MSKDYEEKLEEGIQSVYAVVYELRALNETMDAIGQVLGEISGRLGDLENGGRPSPSHANCAIDKLELVSGTSRARSRPETD